MRNHSDWLEAYISYASHTEAPRRFHFWCGVSAIAGALRRKVWLNMKTFKWHVNHYIVLVAPPGIVSKSTTSAIAMDLLRSVAGVNFGPDVVTWPALVTAFANASDSFEISGEYFTQCALTLESSEFGNLVNPQDREMIDLLVTLWDSKQGAFKKVTKGSGTDLVENPWINMIACTTPAWIAGNFPEHIIGGGFTSRCLFVYADTKDKRVPWPDEVAPPDFDSKKVSLIQDLDHIGNTLIGAYNLSSDARQWGRIWYNKHYDNPPLLLSDDRFGGYLARKQTHICKLGMILAAAQRDELVIEADDLILADKMVSDLEKDMPQVFDKIGRSENSVQAERFIQFINKSGAVDYSTAYQHVHRHFPALKDFEDMIKGAVSAKLIRLTPTPQGVILEAVR